MYSENWRHAQRIKKTIQTGNQAPKARRKKKHLEKKASIVKVPYSKPDIYYVYTTVAGCCRQSRGKFLLELWATTFLPD